MSAAPMLKFFPNLKGTFGQETGTSGTVRDVIRNREHYLIGATLRLAELGGGFRVYLGIYGSAPLFDYSPNAPLTRPGERLTLSELLALLTLMYPAAGGVADLLVTLREAGRCEYTPAGSDFRCWRLTIVLV